MRVPLVEKGESAAGKQLGFLPDFRRRKYRVLTRPLGENQSAKAEGMLPCGRTVFAYASHMKRRQPVFGA